jgi:hypothetical protein
MYNRPYISRKFIGMNDYVGPLVLIDGRHSLKLDKVFNYVHDYEMCDDGYMTVAMGSIHKN